MELPHDLNGVRSNEWWQLTNFTCSSIPGSVRIFFHADWWALMNELNFTRYSAIVSIHNSCSLKTPVMRMPNQGLRLTGLARVDLSGPRR